MFEVPGEGDEFALGRVEGESRYFLGEIKDALEDVPVFKVFQEIFDEVITPIKDVWSMFQTVLGMIRTVKNAIERSKEILSGIHGPSFHMQTAKAMRLLGRRFEWTQRCCNTLCHTARPQHGHSPRVPPRYSLGRSRPHQGLQQAKVRGLPHGKSFQVPGGQQRRRFQERQLLDGSCDLCK